MLNLVLTTIFCIQNKSLVEVIPVYFFLTRYSGSNLNRLGMWFNYIYICIYKKPYCKKNYIREYVSTRIPNGTWKLSNGRKVSFYQYFSKDVLIRAHYTYSEIMCIVGKLTFLPQSLNKLTIITQPS